MIMGLNLKGSSEMIRNVGLGERPIAMEFHMLAILRMICGTGMENSNTTKLYTMRGTG